MATLPNANFGAPPSNANVEQTFSVWRDIIFYAPSTSLTTKKLFTLAENKDSQYRNAIITDIAQRHNTILSGAYVTHSLLFTARGSEDALLTEWYFQNWSFLKITKFAKQMDDIPLALLVPFDICQLGATTASILTRQNPVFRFTDPIEVVPAMDFEFKPATGLTTAASAATNPQLPNLTLSNDYGFSINFIMLGTQKRITA